MLERENYLIKTRELKRWFDAHTDLCQVLLLFSLRWYKQSASSYWLLGWLVRERKALYLHSPPRNSSLPTPRPGRMSARRSTVLRMSRCCPLLLCAWSFPPLDRLVRYGCTKCDYGCILGLTCSRRLRLQVALKKRWRRQLVNRMETMFLLDLGYDVFLLMQVTCLCMCNSGMGLKVTATLSSDFLFSFVAARYT